VGEEAQEMQLAHWLPTTNVAWLAGKIPAWMGVWFSVFPTVETLAAQAVAVALIAGSYWLVSFPASRQQCQAQCAVEPVSADGKHPCTPLCVSATVCQTLNGGDGGHRRSRAEVAAARD